MVKKFNASADVTSRLSLNARRCLEWAGVNDAQIAEDVERLARGAISRHDLEAHCLDGVDDDETAAGWREYVNKVEMVAEQVRS